MEMLHLPDAVKKLISAIFSVLFVLLFPVVITLLSPVYLFRNILPFLVPLFRPNLHKLISTRSISMVVDDPCQDKPKWNLVVWLKLETGDFNLNGFKNMFVRDIMNKRDANGQLTDPEYQQFYSKWLGFYFWEWERDFDIDWHIRKYFASDYVIDSVTGERKLRVTRETDLKEILKELTWKSFPPGKSPWEFLLIPNYKDDGNNNDSSNNVTEPAKSVLIFHLHHGLCDGTKILKLLLDELNRGDLTRTAKPHVITTSRTADRIKNALLFPLVAPYQLMQMILETGDTNVWHKTPEKQLTHPFNFAMTKRLPLSLFHEVKSVNGVTFSAVAMAAIAGGIRRSMIRQGLQVPDKVTAVMPQHSPGHPNTLQNHFVISFIPLPTGVSHPYLRLQKVEASLAAYKTSFISQFIYHMVPFISGLFYWLVEPIYTNNLSTMLVSNFPGPGVPTEWVAGGPGYPLLDVNFTGGIGPGAQGLAFSMLSYSDGIRIIAQADKSLLPDDAAVNQLADDITEELQLLRKAKFLDQ